MKKQKTNEIYLVSFHGNHPEIAEEYVCLQVDKECIRIYDMSLNINYSTTVSLRDIINVSLDTRENIEKKVTATRLLTLGVFAFAAKKKISKKEQYMLIDYYYKNMKNTLVFSGVAVNDIYKDISTLLSEFRENNNIKTLGGNNETINTVNELYKLKKLLEGGLLTKEEFEQLKKGLIN